MLNRYWFLMIIPLVMIMMGTGNNLRAQCFASAGNPVGGAANMGVMDKHSLRVMAFYRYHFASDWFSGDVQYHGPKRIYSSANYNYLGITLGYGLANRLSAELETGYYVNKSVCYSKTNHVQSGNGMSNALLSMKYALYQNPDKHFEVTVAGGLSAPFGREFQRVDGIVLPDDVQPSNASYGVAFQSYMIKENSFKSIRYFWVNRFDKHFANPRGEVFGSTFNTSAFVSRHFVFGQGGFKDWTLILQLRYQYRGQNVIQSTERIIESSGGQMVYFAPQVNCSIREKWNISLMYELPVWQYYNGTQLGANYAFLLNFARDFSLK